MLKGQSEVRFLHFTQTGKMLTLVDCDNLCIENIIPEATTNNLYKKIQQTNHNGTPKSSDNLQEGRKKKTVK